MNYPERHKIQNSPTQTEPKILYKKTLLRYDVPVADHLPCNPFLKQRQGNLQKFVLDLNEGIRILMEKMENNIDEDRLTELTAQGALLKRLRDNFLRLGDDSEIAGAKFISFPVPLATSLTPYYIHPGVLTILRVALG